MTSKHHYSVVGLSRDTRQPSSSSVDVRSYYLPVADDFHLISSMRWRHFDVINRRQNVKRQFPVSIVMFARIQLLDYLSKYVTVVQLIITVNNNLGL